MSESVAGAEVFTPFKLDNQTSAYRDLAFKAFKEMTAFHTEIETAFVGHLNNIGKIEADKLKQDVLDNYFKKYSQCKLAKQTVLGSKVQPQYEGTKDMSKQETISLNAAFDID